VSKLIYSMIESLDGYAADESGNFDWAQPDEVVHSFINDLQRSVGTMLMGRHMYEVMAAWDTLGTAGDEPAYIQDFSVLWRDADKVVYSSELASVPSARAHVEREFVPDAIRKMKAESDRDTSIGGPTLAAAAIGAGLVDEYQLFVVPFVVGGGLATFPPGVRLGLELMEERRFPSGFVYLDYRPRREDR
jgi:dihydrofolate reductase